MRFDKVITHRYFKNDYLDNTHDQNANTEM